MCCCTFRTFFIHAHMFCILCTYNNPNQLGLTSPGYRGVPADLSDSIPVRNLGFGNKNWCLHFHVSELHVHCSL